MAKHKWYVVTVGRDIGVFPTWLAVCPLVEGVSGASHQSFPSEAEAQRTFAEEQAKGNTRIVRDHEPRQRTSPRKAHSDRPTRSNVGSASAPPRSPADSSIIISPRYQYEEPLRRPETPVRPVYSQASSAISRSASEPSSKMRRFEIVDSFFNTESPSADRRTQAPSPTKPITKPPSPPRHVLNQLVEMGFSVEQAETALAQTPTGLDVPAAIENLLNNSSPSGSFRSLQIHDDEPEIIVKTPPWVPSYPKFSPEPQVLSPLDNPSLSLHSFKQESRHATPTQPVRRLRNAGEPCSPATPESSIYVSSPMRPATTAAYAHDVDPRSPIVRPSQTDLMTMNSLSFTRPSPSVKRLQLPSEYTNAEASILFRPNPAILG